MREQLSRRRRIPNPWLSGYLARLADRTLTPVPIVNSIQLARDGELADASLYGRHAQTNLMVLRCIFSNQIVI